MQMVAQAREREIMIVRPRSEEDVATANPKIDSKYRLIAGNNLNLINDFNLIFNTHDCLFFQRKNNSLYRSK